MRISLKFVPRFFAVGVVYLNMGNIRRFHVHPLPMMCIVVQFRSGK
jgi:hypothetical protein